MNLVLVGFMTKLVVDSALLSASSAGAMISAKKRTARTFLEEEGGTQPAEAQPKTSAPRLGGPTPCDDTEGRASLSSSSYTSSEITPGAAMDRSNPRDEKTVADYDDDASGSSEQDSDLHATPSGQPLNFGVVVPGVYRSSFPKEGDYPFLKSLELKTVVTLVQKDFPETYEPFLKANGIKHYVFDMKGTKKEEIPMKTMKAILRLVLDRQNHPLLIHCNHGKHRTGCVVAVVRKVSGWDLSTILDEYKSYATPKVRECDTKYITDFELSSLSNLFPNGSSLGFRVRSFFRATLFTFCVLILWVISGAKMESRNEKRYKEVKEGLP